VRAVYGRDSGWHRIAAVTGHARTSASGLETDVAVTPAGASALDEVDRAYREKYNSHYATIVRP
jgi:hypothetical protein